MSGPGVMDGIRSIKCDKVSRPDIYGAEILITLLTK